MEKKWQILNKVEKKQLLKDIFYDVLFHHQHLPGFMTEQDWNDLFKGATVDCYSFHQNVDYAVILFLETFAYRYWVPGSDKFWILVDFLKNQLAVVKVGDLNLFQSTSTENMKMWFYFNLEAVFLWMSQQQ